MHNFVLYSYFYTPILGGTLLHASCVNPPPPVQIRPAFGRKTFGRKFPDLGIQVSPYDDNIIALVTYTSLNLPGSYSGVNIVDTMVCLHSFIENIKLYVTL